MSAGNLLKMLGGGGPPAPPSGGPGGLLGMLGGGAQPGPGQRDPAAGPPDDQAPDGEMGTCQDCMYWEQPHQLGGQLGLCTMLSDMADAPPDETSITPSGAQFRCAGSWFCKYFKSGNEGTVGAPPTPDSGQGAPSGQEGYQ